MRLAAVLGLSLLWGIWGLGVGNAADWAIVPSINARTEFNSNLNYDFRAPISDFIFTLAPSAQFNYTTDTGQLQGTLGLKGLHYLSNSNLDHIDQNVQINGRYQVSPRLNLMLNAAYISDSSLQEEFLASGLIMTRTPRQSIQAGPGVTYALTERLSAIVNYNFNKVNYQDPRFQNYYGQSVGLRLEQQLKDQKTVLISNVIAQETKYPSQDNIFRSLGFQLGGKHKFSPDWELFVLGGINVSFMDFHTQVQDLTQFPFFISVRQEKVQETTASPFVNLSVTRSWTRFSINGGYSRNQNASAQGSVSDNNQIYLTLNYNFTERLSGNLNGNRSLTSQLSQRNSQSNSYLNVGPQLTYKLTEELSLSPGYRFGLRENITNKQTANSQIVWLMMTYTPLTVASEKRATTPVGTMPGSTPEIGRRSTAGRNLTL
jgi:predicted porin